MFIILWFVNVILNHFSFHFFDTYEKFLIAIIGLVIMSYSLKQSDFKIFCFIYGTIWCVFLLVKGLTFIFPEIDFNHHKVKTINISKYYLEATFLNTPLPFLFYWIIIKSINTIKQK